MRLLPIALGLPGTIGFPTAIAHHRSPHGQVTEVSYTGKNFIVYHPSHSNSAPTSRMDCFVDSLLGNTPRYQERGVTIFIPDSTPTFEDRQINRPTYPPSPFDTVVKILYSIWTGQSIAFI